MANGSGDGRLTKAERKEEARLKRMELEQASNKSKRNRTFTIVAVVLAVALVATALVISNKQKEERLGAIPTGTQLLKKAEKAIEQAGCADVQTTSPYNGVAPDPNNTDNPAYVDRSHIGPDSTFQSMPALSTYPTQPPASGPHAPTTLRQGVYEVPPSIAAALHSLEHGASIIWLNKAATGDEVTQIERFYEQTGLRDPSVSRVIVAPYDYAENGGTLEADAQMVLVAWHRLQVCQQPNLAAAYYFTSRYSAPPATDVQYLGEAPEPGALL